MFLVLICTHIVPKGIEEIRLYDYVQDIFTALPSRKAIKKAISREEILVDGKKTTTGLWVKPGQKIEFFESTVNPPKEYHLALDVIYQDEWLAAINKPAGIPVSGNQFRTIQNALIGNIEPSKEKDALRWPKPVHRLDGSTSGLLLIAKTAGALVKLGQQFQNRSIQKKYCAIVIGKTPKEGVIDFKVENLVAETAYKLVRVVPSLKNKHLSLIELNPKTGRTHQLRIHLANLGFPILGDQLYGRPGEILKGKGLFLTAVALKFNHPVTEEQLTIKIEVAKKFEALMEREERRWNKYNG